MPMLEGIKKVMMIGSGPIVIGQAAEFDYAGTQACRVLKAAGLEVVLVNSNPATIMTDRANADEIYLEPLTLETIRRIIEKERPDGLLAGFGGQTGLTVSSQLAKEGFLDRMGVHILGTPAEAIDRAEDRELFKETMEGIGQPLIPSATTTGVPHALEIAERIGYPVIVRPAFTLGGAGGGVASAVAVPAGTSTRSNRRRSTVTGPTKLHGADVRVPDLRGGFSYLLAALTAAGTSTITNPGLISRGSEHFIEKLEAPGADFRLVGA